MSQRGLQLALEAGQSLPIHLCWRITDGYLRSTGQTQQGETFTLGIWGPGEIVIPSLLGDQPMDLRALSTATVHECDPEAAARDNCSVIQIQQIGTLLQLTRIRPAEARLFHLLLWLSERFGSSTEQGRSVPLEAMNLTHRQLAEMASVSRVTVTKTLGHFRQQGWLQQINQVDMLSNTGVSVFQSSS